MPPPQLHYFACRSRGEPIRLACALAGIEFEEFSVPEEQSNGRRQLAPPPTDPTPRYLSQEAGSLANESAFPFGTCPAWVEQDDAAEPPLRINQSNAILRHIGRRGQLCGSSAAEAAHVDAWLDHCEDVRKAYNDVIYGLDGPPFDESLSNDSPDAAASFAEHTAAVVTSFGPFERRLSDTDTLVGGSLTVADVALFDLFDFHLRLWPEALAPAAFPRLHAHRAAVASQPLIAAYLESGRRWSRVNGNALG